MNKGRPLSLIALDTLNFFYKYDTLLIKEIQPKIEGTINKEEIIKALSEYEQRDPAPC